MIDTIGTLDNSNSGKNFKAGPDIENVTANNAFLGNVHNTSDTVDFCTNVSAQNDTHSSDIFPIHTKTMFPNPHAYNEMLSHYNCILIGCFKDIFRLWIAMICPQYYKHSRNSTSYQLTEHLS